MEPGISRRTFIVGSVGALVRTPRSRMIQTVLGPIDPSELGFTLPHEHVLCDFAGAAATHPGRWNADDVVRLMEPLLRQAYEAGVRGFFDCTPQFIGRDPAILARLSRVTKLHIVTNTGLYGAAGSRYLPAYAFTERPEQLAARWTREAQNGIGSTRIKPGFMKIGVDFVDAATGKLNPDHEKLVRAAALTWAKTGLTIASHTVQGRAALAQLDILGAMGVPAAKFVFVHADGEPDQGLHREVAARGAWVEYDGIPEPGETKHERHRKLVAGMLDRYANRLLLSHDAGWYEAGKATQTPRGYTSITKHLLPALREDGVSEETIRTLTVRNPAEAWAIG